MSLKIAVGNSNPLSIALTGRLDTHTAPQLDKTLDGVLARSGITRLVFEVSQLDYLSSAGIRCFIRARKAIEPAGGKVAIVNPQPTVRKVLDIVKAIPSGGIFSSIAELDAYLDEIQRQVREGE
ncbi:MAG TPA: STAS domain-containing protein [Steroidobacteraceae bacterium]|jgi:anti-anti-sigma factor